MKKLFNTWLIKSRSADAFYSMLSNGSLAPGQGAVIESLLLAAYKAGYAKGRDSK